MTREELIESWVGYRGEANVTNDQLQAIKWAWETLRGSCCQHPQKAAKGKRPRWMSADGHPYRDGYYVTEDARGALAVCLWDTHGWHYAWAPVVRWLDMRLEKEK